MIPESFTNFRRKLFAWFNANRRDLPWRADRDPYRIWVSEVMLQQTTVAAVVPYFHRFLTAFPTVEALAAADEQEVLKLWEGLGYYRRARHLHAAAKRLVADHGGTLPDDPAVWEELPGVGRYILGAVLSQAFDRRLPIVEANSLRVLARLFGYRGDPREGEGKSWVWSIAECLLPRNRAGDFNQALMELGALICTPTSPRCTNCPAARWCDANRLGLQNEIPAPKRTRTPIAVREVAITIAHRGKLLLCRRPSDAGRWQNLWEVPHGELEKNEEVVKGAARIATELSGLIVTLGEELLTIRHAVTHHAIEMVCFAAKRRSGSFASEFYTEGRWVEPAALAEYPMSAPQRRLMQAIQYPSQQRKLF